MSESGSKFDYVKTKREDVDAIPAKHQHLVRKFMKWYTRFNVWVFKKSKGKLWTKFPGGYPICVVGMKGRKSGARREVALIHFSAFLRLKRLGESIFAIISFPAPFPSSRTCNSPIDKQ